MVRNASNGTRKEKEMQALTSEELDAVRIALSIILQHKEQLPLEPEPIETAFEKIDRAIDETRHEKVPCNAYALAPLYIRATNKE